MKRKSIMMFAIIMVAFFTTNCKKDSSTDPVAGTTDVQFNINSVTQNGTLKSALSDTIHCSTLKADYVMYKIDNGNLKRIDVFYIGNIPWTNSIKLSAGAHTLMEFLVYSDNNTPNNTADDILLMATPHSGSLFSGYVTTPLNQNFTTVTDKKTEIKLDVVCFEQATYQNFGFVYFLLNELTIRQQWFFGDFCIKHKSDYTGSPYAQQSGWNSVAGPFIDVPAIFKIEVWRNGILQNTFTNSNQGEKLSVTYGDYTNQTDNFEFKMFILVRQGAQFNYVFFKSWTFTDQTNISQGTDGVVDFILGNCYDSSNPPDLILAPWMNLPPTATYTITGWNPAALGGYVDATLSNIPPSYEIINGVYASNCADHQTTINVGQPYNMDVYSSLYPNLLPLFAQSIKWERINWLYNHLDWYPGYHWYDIQGVIWLYDNPVWDGLAVAGMPALTPMSQLMKANADLYGVGYKVPTGGWAAVLFVPTGTPPNAPTPAIQTMFIQIDP